MNNTGVDETTHSFAKEQLRSVIERIETVNVQIAELTEDRKEIFAEAVANGYDRKALQTIIRMRKQDAAEREAMDQLVETYLNALGDLGSTPLGSAALKRDLGR